MRRPSAYCATSSGIAMKRRRVSTQPLWPPAVRTSDQSSIGSASLISFSSSGGRLVLDKASQSSGGLGAGGAAGGGNFGALGGFFNVAGLGAGTINGLRGGAFRGDASWLNTSNFSPGFTCT